MAKIKQSLSMRILKIIYSARGEIDVDYIQRKIQLTNKQIYNLLHFLHKENLIEKEIIPLKKSSPINKKLLIKISKKGTWAVKRYNL